MLISNSDLSSSILSRSPIISNFETPDESSSSIASIGSHVVQSLALSSPDQDCPDDQDMLTTEASIPPRNSDGSSSSSLIEESFMPSPVNLEHNGECTDTQFMTGPQIPPSNQSESNNSLRIAGTPKTPEHIDEDFWESCSPFDQPCTPKNDSPGFRSDDDSEIACSQPLYRFQQEPLKIEEPTGVGAGLWNLGNTCFINSVLQCFTHTVPLIESLGSYTYQYPCNCNAHFCVMRALRHHIDLALRPSMSTLSPYYFLNNLNYFSPDFQCYQQEDAHEFLQAFLDKLERCCVDRTSSCGLTSSEDVNIVEQVFGGRLVSRLRCCNCNSVSETLESSLGLSLEIEDVDDLSSALESFTRVEKLDEQLTCDNCEEKVSKEKQLLLDKLPWVATFHLKRFKNNGFFMEKIFKHIKIPLEIDLQQYMRGRQGNEVPTKYHLYAFVEHLGLSLTYGHYSSYVRSAPKRWHKFDDEEVTRIDEDRVPLQDSYILFYAREGTSWFSRAFGVMQPLLEASLLNSSPKSVLDPTNGECLSDISYEDVVKSSKPCDSAGVSNPHGKTEENFASPSKEINEDVFLSTESSGEYYPKQEHLDSLDTCDYDSPCTDKEPDSGLAIERADTGDELVRLPMFNNQGSSLKQQGTFEMQPEELETTKNQEESCKQPLSISDVADSMATIFSDRDNDMMNNLPRSARVLDQGICKTGSPPKKIKIT